jgi:hypothetical protein
MSRRTRLGKELMYLKRQDVSKTGRHVKDLRKLRVSVDAALVERNTFAGCVTFQMFGSQAEFH